MNKVTWIIFASVIVLLLGGVVVFTRLSNPSADVSAINLNNILSASPASGNIADHVYGNAESKVVFFEYGDFQCPSCGGAHPQVKSVVEEYKDKIAFVFRNFPLTTKHPNARAAAAAVEAAGLQGKYWEMHNLIFESQDAWVNLNGDERTNKFTEYAVSLGVNKEQFLSDLGGEAVNKKISFDQALGKKAAVDATPTFFLLGKKIDTATASATVKGDSTKLKAAFDAALAQ